MRRVAFMLGAVTMAAVVLAEAQDRAEIDSIYVKGAKEFPQTVYVVPWKDVKGRERKDQQLVLHSLYGDLFDPVYVPAAAPPNLRVSR